MMDTMAKWSFHSFMLSFIGEKTERLYFEEYTLSLSVFSPIATYIALYFYVSSTVKRKNQYTDFQFINIFMYKNKVT